jgi:hypothetical protein
MTPSIFRILSCRSLRFAARDTQLPEHLIGDFSAFIGQEDFSARRIAGRALDRDEAKSRRPIAGFSPIVRMMRVITQRLTSISRAYVPTGLPSSRATVRNVRT